MYVCICNCVTEDKIRAAICNGYSMDQLVSELKVTTCCGSCNDYIQDMVNENTKI